MNNREFCEKINISEPTLYNWKKEKPLLYEIVMEYKKKTYSNEENKSNESILLKYFNKLSEIEQEFYISDIKTRFLKKEIEKGN